MKLSLLVEPTQDSDFQRCIARLEKKYPNVWRDVLDELKKLAQNETAIPSAPNVVAVPGLGRVVLKVRVASTDQQTGKRGGFRVLLVAAGGGWKPFFVYAKTKRSDVPRDELLELLSRV